MLGKLIGYDNRIQSKFFGGVYAVMGVLAGIAAVLKALNEHFNHVIVLQIRISDRMGDLPGGSHCCDRWKHHLCDRVVPE